MPCDRTFRFICQFPKPSLVVGELSLIYTEEDLLLIPQLHVWWNSGTKKEEKTGGFQVSWEVLGVERTQVDETWIKVLKSEPAFIEENSNFVKLVQTTARGNVMLSDVIMMKGEWDVNGNYMAQVAEFLKTMPIAEKPKLSLKKISFLPVESTMFSTNLVFC